MAKTKAKVSYVCQNCGYVTASWLGKCPECGTWNSFSEQLETKTKEQGYVHFAENTRPRTVSTDGVTRQATRLILRLRRR